MSWKPMMTAAAAALAILAFGAASAQDFGAAPAGYQLAAETYVTERLTHPRGPRFQFISEPYQVVADIDGREGLACWAVDVRVKARLPGGGYGGYVPYTVLFLNGEAVALEGDARRIARL